MGRILIVDDEPGARHFLEKIFSGEYQVATAATGEEAVAAVRAAPPDLLLLDLRLPGMDGMAVLQEVQRLDTGLPVVLMTAFGDTDKAIQAMERGAFDYLTKPLDIDAVRATLRKAMRARQVHVGEQLHAVASDGRLKGERLIGNAPPMVELSKVIGQVARSGVTVLIRGESGTGKDLVARTVHRYSRRAGGPFVALNCAAIPDTLLESELFGYERGAFSGADAAGKAGKLEQADGGTLFLDEIGDMSLATQAKVLRVLQNGVFHRLGGNRPLQPDVRVVAATNKELERRIVAGEFRDDLYHRLNVVTLQVPPLRDHVEDIAPLVEHFIQRFNAELRLNVQGFEEGVIEYLQAYDWPGNVRELENRIKKAMVLCKYDYLPLDYFQEEVPLPFQGREAFLRGFDFVVENALERCLTSDRPPYETILRRVEQVLVERVLETCGGNQVRAANLLGITRTTLRKKIKDFGL